MSNYSRFSFKNYREWTKNWAQDLTERDQSNSPSPKRQKRWQFQPNGRFKNMEKDFPKIQAYNLETSMGSQLEEKQLPKIWAKEMTECVLKCLYIELIKIVGQVHAKEFTDAMMNALNIRFNGTYFM